MKKSVVVTLLIFIGLLSINFVLSETITEDLHVNLQTTDATGKTVTGTFGFVFNISTTSNCANVIYTNSTTLTTDDRGIISYYLPNVSLNFSQQYYLCYYRDGVLKDSTKIARTPYSFTTKNITISGIIADSNLNVTPYNVSASYFFGSGRYLTDLNVSALNMSSYIPYTGADKNVNLGNNNFTINVSTLFVNVNTNKVGIGTTNAFEKLHVNGNILANGTINATTDLCIQGGVCLSKAGTGSGTISGTGATGYIPMWNGTNSLNNSAIYQTGAYIGINTSSSTVMLNVSSTDTPQIVAYGNQNGGFFQADRSSRSVGGSGLIFATAGATKAYLLLPTNDDNTIRFATPGGQSLMDIRINTSTIGIGANNASYKLNVAGIVNAYEFLVNGSAITAGEPLWSANYSAYNASWSSITNTSYMTGDNFTLQNTSMLNYVNFQNTSQTNLISLNNVSMKNYVDSAFVTQNNISNLSVNNSEYFDSYDSSFFMPLNTSVYGQFDFNGGWQNNGLSLIGGSLYAQSGYFYNISSLQVTNLNINGSLLPYSGFDSQFDIGSQLLRWKDLYLSGQIRADIANISGTLYVAGVNISQNNESMKNYVNLQNNSVVNYITAVNTSMKNYVDSQAEGWNNMTNSSYITGDNFTLQNTSMKNYIATVNTSMQNYVNVQNSSIVNYIATVNTSMNNSLRSLYIPFIGAYKNIDLGSNNFTVNVSTFFINTNNSRVGIGTITPQNKFNVIGDMNVTGSVIIGSANITTLSNGDVNVW